MPITDRVDTSLRIAFSIYRGVVTVEEIRAARPELLRHPGFEPSFRQLADNREITHLDLRADDLQELAAASAFGQDSCRAFVVSKPAHFGMARQFEMWQHRTGKLRIFRDMEEARRWLGLE